VARKRQRYTDDFRASAVVMLEAQGYPDNPGALTVVASHLHIPHQTLSRWAREAQNPAPPELVQEKRADLKELLRAEIDAALKAMPGVRPDASYRDLVTASGIMIDKLQLLEGNPTERQDVTSGGKTIAFKVFYADEVKPLGNHDGATD
jgi:transposase-like protein